MGCGQSALNDNAATLQAPGSSPRAGGPSRASAINLAHPDGRRVQIFEPSQNQEDVDLSKLLTDKKLDPETKALIQKALSEFFGDENAKNKLKLVIGAMEKENFHPNSVIIHEGEPGDKLYIIQEGEMEVSIAGKGIVRTMGKGDMVGQLALLYDAPRSATVCTTKNVVAWSLSREHFKSVQAVSTSAVHLQRAKWLINSTDLATLSQIDLSRLIGVLQVSKYADGEDIYTEGDPADICVLIASGNAKVSSKSVMTSVEGAEKDKLLGIVRPKSKRRSMEDLDVEEFAAEMKKLHDVDECVDPSGIAVDVGGDDFVYEGCLLGIHGMRAKAGLESGAWQWNSVSKTTSAPFTIRADGPVDALIFSVKVFETLFGPDALKSKKTAEKLESGARNLRKFEPSMFKMKHVLGSGSFGVVIYAQSQEDKSGQTFYALKVLSKPDVLSTGQLRHVKDERSLLALMESPFILKLYGTYQTPHQLVFVTESLNNGDMWSVIYEPPFYNKGGLPPKLILFYTSSIVMALSHIHSKGMAYRDLKPENIMIDSKGYVRIIDFGFAKTIPYTKVDEITQESKVYAKSYTLCGTPEYLAPEFVFNLGHDHSADLWALGVMLYEFYMGGTPFAPKRPDNITELFNNIAVTKTNGVRIPAKLEERARNKIAGDLILLLLKPEPSERKGVQEGYTSVILEHEFFQELDVEALVNGTMKPVHIPSPPQSNVTLSTLPAIKSFKGDQKQFDFF